MEPSRTKHGMKDQEPLLDGPRRRSNASPTELSRPSADVLPPLGYGGRGAGSDDFPIQVGGKGGQGIPPVSTKRHRTHGTQGGYIRLRNRQHAEPSSSSRFRAMLNIPRVCFNQLLRGRHLFSFRSIVAVCMAIIFLLWMYNGASITNTTTPSTPRHQDNHNVPHKGHDADDQDSSKIPWKSDNLPPKVHDKDSPRDDKNRPDVPSKGSLKTDLNADTSKGSGSKTQPGLPLNGKKDQLDPSKDNGSSDTDDIPSRKKPISFDTTVSGVNSVALDKLVQNLGQWNSIKTVGDGRYTDIIPLTDLRLLYRPPDASYGVDGQVMWKQRISELADTWSGRHQSLHQDDVSKNVFYGAGHRHRRILVTGGAGFVGSHLVDRLMLAGHDVIVLDNFFTGKPENVAHWIGHPRFELRRGDVTAPNQDHLADLASLEVDQIYHLACPASPPHYKKNPIKTIKTSVLGTIHMLGLAKRVKARILLTSTSEVYGDPEEHPQKETYNGHVNPIGPRACYDEGKRVAETLMYSYKSMNQVDVRVARIFNTFGPRMNENDGRVVSNFILAALRGQDLKIYGSGKQTRSFQYVHDLVDGLIALMEAGYDQPVNLGNPQEYSMNQFAKLVVDVVAAAGPKAASSPSHPQVAIIHTDPSQDDPQNRQPDIHVAERELGWKPKFTMFQGLVETTRYFRNRLSE